MIELKTARFQNIKTDALIIPVCEDTDIHSASNTMLFPNNLSEYKEFAGKEGDKISFYGKQGIEADRMIFFGIGKLSDITEETFRKTAGKAVRESIAKGFENLAFLMPDANKLKIEAKKIIQATGEGAYLANNIFLKYKNKKEKKPLEKIYIAAKPEKVAQVTKLFAQIKTVCNGTLTAREWANTPSNDKKPKIFAQSIIEAAKKHNIKTTLFSEKEISDLKMGGILEVAAGSEAKPFMLILDYNPKNTKEIYAFVGKGVTFDSGGINLKQGSGLEGMKFDMAGAAAVAASVITLAKLKSKYRIIAALPIVENMPSGSALRPGDVIKSFCGKTVEVNNTDAEGRLILADAISYVEKEYKPKVIIDIATLTGACVVALGENIAGVFSADKKLADAIIEAGDNVYERCWAMPMPADYKKFLKSGVADISNISNSRWGGAITASLFLSEFVKNTKWAHIDIAGPASAKKASDYCEAGGTGFGVRLITDLILQDRLKNI